MSMTLRFVPHLPSSRFAPHLPSSRALLYAVRRGSLRGGERGLICAAIIAKIFIYFMLHGEVPKKFRKDIKLTLLIACALAGVMVVSGAGLGALHSLALQILFQKQRGFFLENNRFKVTVYTLL